MNGLAVLLCVAALGVQQSWRTTQEGELEYVLQVEPRFLASLEQRENVTSNLPATAKEVHRLCLRISAGDLAKTPQRKPDLAPLDSQELRATKGEPDIPVALVVDAQGRVEETTDISHGWLATKDGRVQYLVQLAPDLLTKLREGDEIYMNIYPEAGQIQQFIVFSGQEILPRKAAVVAAPPAAPLRPSFTAKGQKNIAPVAAENLAMNGPAGEASPAPGARLRGPRAQEPQPQAGEPSRLRSPPRYTVADEPKEQPAEQPTEQPLYGAEPPMYGPQPPLYGPRIDNRGPAAAPELFNSNPAAEYATEEQPEEAPVYGPAYGPADYGPVKAPPPRAAASEGPVFDRSQFDKSQFASPPTNKPRTSPTSLAPVNDNSQYLPEEESSPSRTRVGFGNGNGNVSTVSAEEDRTAIDDNRTAAVESTKRRTSLSAGSTKSSKSGDEEEAKPWWPLFFTCCALFMSVGGNLYLGWTAAEFYSRYRLAIERMRGGSRDSSRDTRDD